MKIIQWGNCLICFNGYYDPAPLGNKLQMYNLSLSEITESQIDASGDNSLGEILIQQVESNSNFTKKKLQYHKIQNP